MNAGEDRENGKVADRPDGTGGRHTLAIGYYVGALVLGFGAILLLTGLFTPPTRSEERLGFDLSAWWGGVMALFGLVIVGLSWWSRRRHSPSRDG